MFYSRYFSGANMMDIIRNGIFILAVFLAGISGALLPSQASASTWDDLGGSLAGDLSCVARAGQKIDCFARGTDNNLWQRSSTALAWSAWVNLGGGIIQSPKCISRGSSFIDCFAANANNALVRRSWDGSNWSGWAIVGGILNGSPECVSWAVSRIDCFVRWSDNSLRHIALTYNGTTVSLGAWQNLGGTVRGAISCAAWPNTIHCLTQGADNNHISGNGSTWSAWDGPSLVSDFRPQCISGGVNSLDCFVTTRGGYNGGIGRWRWNSGSWLPQTVVMNAIISAPSCIYTASGRTDCFGIGWAGDLHHRAEIGTSWGNYELLGGVTLSSPECVSWGVNRVDCFVRGQDNAMYHIGWNN